MKEWNARKMVTDVLPFVVAVALKINRDIGIRKAY